MVKEDPRLHDIILNKWCGGKVKQILEMFNIPYSPKVSLEDFGIVKEVLK